MKFLIIIFSAIMLSVIPKTDNTRELLCNKKWVHFGSKKVGELNITYLNDSKKTECVFKNDSTYTETGYNKEQKYTINKQWYLSETSGYKSLCFIPLLKDMPPINADGTPTFYTCDIIIEKLNTDTLILAHTVKDGSKLRMAGEIYFVRVK